MATIKTWVIENISPAFVSVKLRGPGGDIVRAEGIRPGQVRQVRDLFRNPDGSPDIEGCRANQDIVSLQQSGRLRLYERETVQKIANAGVVFNENDPEPKRVEKILEHRRRVKEAAKGRSTSVSMGGRRAAESKRRSVTEDSVDDKKAE